MPLSPKQAKRMEVKRRRRERKALHALQAIIFKPIPLDYDPFPADPEQIRAIIAGAYGLPMMDGWGWRHVEANPIARLQARNAAR